MRRVLICVLLLMVVSATFGFVAYGADLTPEVMIEHLQSHPEAFESIVIKDSGVPVDFNIKLGVSSTKIAGEHEFDGFRFRMPKSAVGSDMVWYFNVSREWSEWFIVPVEGKVTGGFRNWFNADKLYSKYDDVKEKDRFRAQQTLVADYFKSGAEYIIWFRNHGSKTGCTVLGRLMFAKSDSEWSMESIEEVLKLEPQNASAQIQLLGSRGGRILLDGEFFERGYAEARIDSVFFSKRHTSRMRSGFFVTIETAIPTCTTDPSLKDIIKRYGQADCVITSKEEKLLAEYNGRDEEDEEDEASVSTYYYDYFGLEVAEDDPAQEVQRVVSHANDYSVLNPPDDGGFFARIGLKNMTVFYRKKKEVGRLYYFMEGSKVPLILKDPPAGLYKSSGKELDYKGKGRWTLKEFREDGTLGRVMRFRKHQMSGMSQGYYSNGKKSYSASYKDGRPHGTVIRYDESGKEIEKTVFENGIRKAVPGKTKP